MLRDDAVFGISFKQLGHSGFMTVLEIARAVKFQSEANGSHARR
jgi:hypothetical protein